MVVVVSGSSTSLDCEPPSLLEELLEELMAACRSWPVAPQGWVAASRSRRPASSRPNATAGSSPRDSDFFRFHVFWGDCWRESSEKNTYLAGRTQLHRTLGLGPVAITLSHHYTVDTDHEKHVDSEPGCSCPRQCCSWWLNCSGEAALQLYLLMLPCCPCLLAVLLSRSHDTKSL